MVRTFPGKKFQKIRKLSETRTIQPNWIPDIQEWKSNGTEISRKNVRENLGIPHKVVAVDKTRNTEHSGTSQNKKKDKKQRRKIKEK